MTPPNRARWIIIAAAGQRPAGRSPRWLVSILFAVLTGANARASADQPLPLPAAVAAVTRSKVVPLLERDGVKSVGVLKFLALLGEGPAAAPSARLGAINSDLAAQFQTAILLNVSRNNPIAVLRNPDDVAAGIDGATHLTPEGQAKLFKVDFPMVVGTSGQRVKPEAFIFGIVPIADDLETVVVDVRMIRRGVAEATEVARFEARLGVDDLSAVGQSFVATRGLFDGGTVKDPPVPEQVAAQPITPAALADDVREGRRPFPLADPEAPMKLSIAYDGAIQAIELRGGGAFVAEPRQGQKTKITLAKRAKDGRRYAVALKVNGENTAERGVLPDIKGRKWILSDDYMTLPVEGYVVGDNLLPFNVVEGAKAAKLAFNYGVDAGTITMTVFAEEKGPQPVHVNPPLVPADNVATTALDDLLLAGGVRLDPGRTFDSLDEAKESLKQSLATVSRGLIVPDVKEQRFEKRIVPFVPIRDPVMAVVIRYFMPQ